MAKKVKDYYDVPYLEELAGKIMVVTSNFNKEIFLKETKDKIEDLEFNQRQELVAQALNKAFDVDYENVLKIFSKILGKELRGNSGAFTEGWWLWPVGRYVEIYGDEYFDESRDEHERVRRLSSECLRIRLPWSKKLFTALEYFDEYFEILSNLKDDKDKYIQKSVANNLNDLYKEDKDKFNFIINTWKTDKAISKECEWVIKHGSRTADKKM